MTCDDAPGIGPAAGRVWIEKSNTNKGLDGVSRLHYDNSLSLLIHANSFSRVGLAPDSLASFCGSVHRFHMDTNHAVLAELTKNAFAGLAVLFVVSLGAFALVTALDYLNSPIPPSSSNTANVDAPR
jgi:hypothetical protein